MDHRRLATYGLAIAAPGRKRRLGTGPLALSFCVLSGAPRPGPESAILGPARNGPGPNIRFQFLKYPCLDDRLETAGSREITDLRLWNRQRLMQAWRDYLAPDSTRFRPTRLRPGPRTSRSYRQPTSTRPNLTSSATRT
jgi:hypothetical protein